MSIVIQTQAIADAQGGLHLYLPDATVTPYLQVQLKVEIQDLTNGSKPFSKRFATREDYKAAMDRLFGKCDDPTFMPPPDQAMEEIEPL